MNKQELIKKYEEYENGLFDIGAKAACQIFLKDLQQLDEPQPVKVPQFVADWYEEHKDEFEYNVWDWLSSKSELRKIDSKFAFWLNDIDNTPIQTLVNMHQFGYEVEEEKRYLVKMKGIEQKKSYLNFNFGGVWLFYNEDDFGGYRAHHTRKELEEAGFGWVFSCEGIEIKEVE